MRRAAARAAPPAPRRVPLWWCRFARARARARGGRQRAASGGGESRVLLQRRKGVGEPAGGTAVEAGGKGETIGACCNIGVCGGGTLPANPPVGGFALPPADAAGRHADDRRQAAHRDDLAAHGDARRALGQDGGDLRATGRYVDRAAGERESELLPCRLLDAEVREVDASALDQQG